MQIKEMREVLNKEYASTNESYFVKLKEMIKAAILADKLYSTKMKGAVIAYKVADKLREELDKIYTRLVRIDTAIDVMTKLIEGPLNWTAIVNNINIQTLTCTNEKYQIKERKTNGITFYDVYHDEIVIGWCDTLEQAGKVAQDHFSEGAE